jgi:nucleoside-diphosphate-sugar epimerase
MIFILGGKGFVGAAFARHCRASGLPHTVIDVDNYRDHVGGKCEILINANGNSRKFLAREDPVREFRESVESVRASLVDFKAGRYVHLSTGDVYPDCSSPETTREETEIDIALQSPYGFHKYLAEQCVRHAAERWLIVRMGGFVGPGLKKNPIYDILHGGPLWLDPESRLEYLHTDENARIVFELIDRDMEDEIVNVCGKGLVTLSEVMETAGKTVEVKAGSPRITYDVSIEKLEKILPVPESRKTVLDFVNQEGRSLEA